MNYPEILKGRVATYECIGKYSDGEFHLRWVWIDTTWSNLSSESDWFGFETLEECIEDHRVHVEKLHAIRYGETISQSLPVPAGEVGELVRQLGSMAADAESADFVRDAAVLYRAIKYLERQVAPVPVSERLPEATDCDDKGRCWVGYGEAVDEYDSKDQELNPAWELCKVHPQDEFWLPAHSLPIPPQL